MAVTVDVRNPITAADVLGTAHCAEAVRDWLESGHDGDAKSALARLSPGTRGEIGRQIAAAVEGELSGITVGDLLVDAWRSYEALETAGRETAAAPHTRQVVEMASHSMEVSCPMSLRVSVDGAVIDALDVDIELHLVVQALVATVAQGRLISIGAGTCTAAVTITTGAFETTSPPAVFDLAPLTTFCLGKTGISLVPAGAQDTVTVSSPDRSALRSEKSGYSSG